MGRVLTKSTPDNSPTRLTKGHRHTRRFTHESRVLATGTPDDSPSIESSNSYFKHNPILNNYACMNTPLVYLTDKMP